MEEVQMNKNCPLSNDLVKTDSNTPLKQSWFMMSPNFRYNSISDVNKSTILVYSLVKILLIHHKTVINR